MSEKIIAKIEAQKNNYIAIVVFFIIIQLILL